MKNGINSHVRDDLNGYLMTWPLSCSDPAHEKIMLIALAQSQ